MNVAKNSFFYETSCRSLIYHRLHLNSYSAIFSGRIPAAAYSYSLFYLLQRGGQTLFIKNDHRSLKLNVICRFKTTNMLQSFHTNATEISWNWGEFGREKGQKD